jgi:hypothetical protein
MQTAESSNLLVPLSTRSCKNPSRKYDKFPNMTMIIPHHHANNCQRDEGQYFLIWQLGINELIYLGQISLGPFFKASFPFQKLFYREDETPKSRIKLDIESINCSVITYPTWKFQKDANPSQNHRDHLPPR